MSVTASCDTETTSTHLAGGPTTTLAVAAKLFLLCGFHCIGIIWMDRIVFMGFIFHVSSGEEATCFQETGDLQNYTPLLSM
jgi:hypothetical protein